MLANADVANALQGCTALRVNGTALDAALREHCGLRDGMPRLVLIDVAGNVVFRASKSTEASTLATMIKAAKERVAKMVAARDAD